MSVRTCRECGAVMIATDHPNYPGRQFWRCDNDDQCFNIGLLVGGEPVRYELTDFGRAALAEPEKVPFDVAAHRAGILP